MSNKERRLEGAVELDPLWGGSAYATVARPQSVVSINKKNHRKRAEIKQEISFSELHAVTRAALIAAGASEAAAKSVANSITNAERDG